MTRSWARASLLATILALCVAGCPKKTNPDTSGATDSIWVVFDVSEKGSGNALTAAVWVDPHRDDFETLIGGEGEQARFNGFGKTGNGYAVAFEPNESLTFVAWAPGHEMATVEAKLKKGENLVTIELRKTAVEDDRVPDQIRLDMLERLPTQGPRTGS